MCNFLSAIYLKGGKLICQPQFSNSHSDLMLANNIVERKTDAPVQLFVKLELTPPACIDDWPDLTKWKEVVDEAELPEWFDGAARFDAFEQMREIVEQGMIPPVSSLVFGRLLLLIRDWEGCVRTCYVVALSGSKVRAYSGSTVGAYSGSKVRAYSGSKVGALSGSTVRALSGSTVHAYSGSKVGALSGSKVGALSGSTVHAYSGSTVDAHSGSTVHAYSGSTVNNV